MRAPGSARRGGLSGKRDVRAVAVVRIWENRTGGPAQMDRETEKTVAELATAVARSFTESDWKELAQRVGFRKQVHSHPRLLRSLSWNDSDYAGHVLDMLNAMVEADTANLTIIQAKVQGDDSAFFGPDARYRTGELLGYGGYGQVFREHDCLLDMEFARKDLSPSPQVTDEVIGRFLREARILFRLSHPNIIKVCEVGRRGRTAYIRMELFKGERLSSLGQVPPERARKIVAQITDAIAHAHARNVVHRDLKPSNVMILENDVRVIDFGMGAFIEADLDTRLTRSDQTIAGGSYAAPELKEDSRVRDPRCDIFSIGALWFNLVTSRDPSGASLKDILTAVGDVPEQDQALILSCMSAPDQRPAGAVELWQALQGLEDNSSTRLTTQAANELSDDETRVMAAFAIAYPVCGEHVNAGALKKTAATAKLRDELRFGLAIASLEGREYLSHFTDDGDRYWSLTSTGKNWLARSSYVVLRLSQNDRSEDMPPF